MQLFDKDLSTFSLQRWVGWLTAAGSFVIGLINAGIYLRILRFSLVAAVARPEVWVLILLAVLMYLTSVADSRALRVCQLLFFGVGALPTALDAEPGNVTSALFVVFILVLANEYLRPRSRNVLFYALPAAYFVLLAVSIPREVAVAFAANMVVFTMLVVAIFGLVLHRQSLIRKRHEDHLEEMVAERTVSLNEALAQRDVMIREIHHRIGNSLQLLSSYLNLQRGDMDDVVAQQALGDAERRAHAIAGVHATLYGQEHLVDLTLAEYVTELLHGVSATTTLNVVVTPQVQPDLVVDIDFAIPFGLVLTELITHAIAQRHGDQGQLTVDVDISADADRLRVRLAYNAAGVVETETPEALAAKSTEIIDSLVRQKRGEIRRRINGGTEVIIEYPRSEIRSHQAILIPGPTR